MEKKTVITRVNEGTAYCRFFDGKAVKCDVFYDDENNILGNIYVGYVCDIVKNINSAFIEYEQGKKAYLQLSDRVKPVFLNKKNTNALCCGDRIIVQISKESIKTKNPVCTTEFELAGRYIVITHGDEGIFFSKKINDKDYKEKMTALIEKYTISRTGITIRTNAYTANTDDVLSELKSLSLKYEELINIAQTRTKNFMLYEADNGLMSLLKDTVYDENERIVTDDENIYEMIKNTGYFRTDDSRSTQAESRAGLEFYKDDLLPLYKLCSLEKVFDEITARKIWLKSGGYLIIDYTEAMTVIDVNTGKCDKGRDKEKTFLNVNLEAAAEISRLLSLRNISGIIIVDFIDMADAKSRETLLNTMMQYAAMDKINTNVVDYTRLQLMEITRKKTRDRVKLREFWEK